MSIPPENVEVGRCCLTRIGQVAQVLRLLPGGRLHYEFRDGAGVIAFGWNKAVTDVRSFSYLAEREVSRDWTPDADEASR